MELGSLMNCGKYEIRHLCVFKAYQLQIKAIN